MERDCIGNFCCGIFNGLYIYFIGIIARKYFHTSALEISVLQTAPLFAGMIGLIIASFTPINKENKVMAYMGMIGASFILVLAPVIPYNKSYLFLIMCLGYNVCASFGPLYMVVLGRIYREEIMAKMLAIARPFLGLTSIIATAAATLVINKNIYGYDVWRILFVLGASIRKYVFLFLQNQNASCSGETGKSFKIYKTVIYTAEYRHSKYLAYCFRNILYYGNDHNQYINSYLSERYTENGNK